MPGTFHEMGSSVVTRAPEAGTGQRGMTVRYSQRLPGLRAAVKLHSQFSPPGGAGSVQCTHHLRT